MSGSWRRSSSSRSNMVSLLAPTVPRVQLSSQGLEVLARGLGCMGMSAFYGPPKAEEDMIHLIHHVVELGITFFDTADAYGPFNNKILSGKVSLSNNVLAL